MPRTPTQTFRWFIRKRALFIDYLLSEECQTALAETTIRGTMTSIPQTNEAMKPFDEINVVYEDQKAVAEQQTSMLERWTDLLTG